MRENNARESELNALGSLHMPGEVCLKCRHPHSGSCDTPGCECPKMNTTSMILNPPLATLFGGEREQWRHQALCSEAETSHYWFSKDHLDIRIAKEICFSCPAKLPCLLYALENQEEQGIWGGYTPRERRKFTKTFRT